LFYSLAETVQRPSGTLLCRGIMEELAIHFVERLLPVADGDDAVTKATSIWSARILAAMNKTVISYAMECVDSAQFSNVPKCEEEHVEVQIEKA
jgi:hypothetical protein